MRTLEEVIAAQSPESQAIIKAMADEMILETGLQMMREELQLSQKQVADAMGISQPAVTQLEQRGNDLKLATLKRYVEAMGGKLSLDVELPTGKRVALTFSRKGAESPFWGQTVVGSAVIVSLLQRTYSGCFPANNNK